MDELALVEAAVLVLVEHLDEIACHVLVEAHLLLDDGDHFFGTQNSVAILIQVVETRRDLVIATQH